ncbi:MAG: hypothetical protein D6725_15655 [Planctomycetota bacterium]|nr:MAG: hypothetical protein D6725_15655 [Planctomycetota bacterium]
MCTRRSASNAFRSPARVSEKGFSVRALVRHAADWKVLWQWRSACDGWRGRKDFSGRWADGAR